MQFRVRAPLWLFLPGGLVGTSLEWIAGVRVMRQTEELVFETRKLHFQLSEAFAGPGIVCLELRVWREGCLGLCLLWLGSRQ